MEEWNDGRTEEWEILPHRHREHIEEGMEGWRIFTTEALRALRNTEKREWKNGRMEIWKTERQATAWRNIDRIDGQHEVWRCSAPKYPGNPQRGEMFVELAGNKGFLRCSAPEYSYTRWLEWFFSSLMHNYLSFYIHSLALIFRCAAPLKTF